MTFVEYVKRTKPRVDRALEDFFDDRMREFASVSALAPDVLRRLKRFSVLGKSVRGCLVLLAAAMFGCRDRRNSLKAATAVELIHSGFLVHDDIMDNDLTRRGQPTVFAQYIPLARRKGSPDPYMSGVSLGICAGDLAYFLAQTVLTEISLAPPRRDHLLRIFNEEITKVGFAQMDDVYWGFASGEPDRTEIESIYRHKTSRYTFSLPMILGAVIAGRSAAVLRQVERLGETVGLVFQLRDDVIGLLSTDGEIGKPAGSDVRENKKTLIRHLLYRRASALDRRILDRVFGRVSVGVRELDRVRSVWKDSGMDDVVAGILARGARRAEEIISGLPVEPAFRRILSDLSVWVGERNK